MIAATLGRLLNLPALFAYLRSHRPDRSVHDPVHDLELALYGAVFGNDFLHYGYFDPPPADPEQLSLADLKRAMDAYATLVVARVRAGERVLDVGCGMGGLLARLHGAGVAATGVTPNRGHLAHIRARWPAIPLVESTMEALQLEPGWDALVNAESFQYVDLEAGLGQVRRLLRPGGRWIVVDYFRLSEQARNRSGHLLQAFEAGIARHGFGVVERLDITENVLPSLAYGMLLATRFGLPLTRFAAERFFLARPLLAYLFRDRALAKLDGVRLDTLDPEVFRRDKRYQLFVLSVP